MTKIEAGKSKFASNLWFQISILCFEQERASSKLATDMRFRYSNFDFPVSIFELPDEWKNL